MYRKELFSVYPIRQPLRRRNSSQEEEEGNGSNNFQVPNSLRHKTTGDETAAAHKDVIEDASQLITQHRLTQLTTQVSALATQAKKLNGDNNPAKTLIKVTRLLDQISSHVDAQGNNNLIILADSMHRVVNVIAETDDPAHGLWDTLVFSGQAMSAILWDRAETSEMVITALDQAMAAIGRQNA